jgi:hypothetical protein
MEHAAKTKYDRELEHLAEVCDGVGRISKTLSAPDAAKVDAALALLDEHRQTTEDLKVLAEKLMEIETEYESDAAAFPDQMGKNDLAACIMALDAVFEFLHLRVYSLNLGILRMALVEIVVGASPAAMFQPEQHGRGRRLDSHLVQKTKGMLAGMMEVQQKAGMSRTEAAKWIVKNVSPTLASRISSKPLTPRAVEEWLDKWGGKFGEEGVARDSYRLWRTHDPVDPKRFREITEDKAKRLPARKPK